MLSEQEFRQKADEAISSLERRLNAVGDDYGFEADNNSGALSIEFDEPPGKFVVSPNTPPRQIWVSALSKSFKLDWDESKSTFAGSDGETLQQLMERVIGQHLGSEVNL